MAVSQAGFALCGSVEPNVGVALEATPEEDHGAGFLAWTLFRLREPAWGAMECSARVEVLYFLQDLLVSLVGRGCGGADVVDDHLDDQYLFLEAGSRWDEGANNFLKFGARLEELV